MAEVKLTVKVVREQVDKLQADIDKLKKTTINISAKQATENLKQAQKALQDFEKTQQAELKTEQEREKLAQQQSKSQQEQLKVEKELARVAKEGAAALKEAARAEKEHANADKASQQTSQASIRAERERIKLTREQERATRQADKAAKEHNETAKKQGIIYDILGRSVSSFILRMTAYRAVYSGIRAIVNGFKEAVDTLRQVDDELVTVRKVTGFDAAQMAGVESQAYSVASKYGANAADYVSGVASFARAGYKELSGDLAELAQKTIIVGDTTADIATQFLLSVDAAYKYKGSITELSKVLDMANELDNKYATSIEKIAEGMGIVAPVAAQMHVGVNELAAAIGTVTAVTQRSGTEAARALRALFLNIVGDTKTEIEEGVTWTTGEIAGLKDIIKEYAPEAYKAAQATGSIIDPMEAIGGLAKSMQEGLLTEQELMEMVSDIGGKLRTSQLLALIQNWDMYNSMLKDTENAIGSADKEIENAMDSWTRKTNVLKNTFTEFVKTGLSSSTFKGIIDSLTWLVQHFDNLGNVIARAGTAITALKLLKEAHEMETATKELTRFNKVMQNIGVSANGLKIAAGALGVLSLAWTAYSMIVEENRRKHEEQVKAIYEAADAAQDGAKKIVELTAEMSTAEAGSDSYKQSIEDLASALGTTLPENADEAIKKLRELSAEQLKAAADAANTARITAGEEFVSASGDLGGVYNRDRIYALPAKLQNQINPLLNGLRTYEGSDWFDVSTLDSAVAFRKAMEEVNAAFNEYIRTEGDASVRNSAYYEALQKYLIDTQEAYAEYNKRKDAAFDAEAMEIFQRAISNSSIKSQEDLDALISRFKGARTVSEETREKLVDLANEYFHFAEATEQSSAALKKETVDLYANQKALDANATSEERAAAAKKDAANAARMLIPYLFDEQNQLTAVGKAALMSDKNLSGLVQAELEAQLAASQANYSSLVAQLATIGITAETTAAQLWAMARAAAGDNPFSGAIMGALGGAYTGYQGLLKSRMAEIKSLMAQISGISSYSGVAPSWTSSGSSHSGGSHSGGSSGGSHSGGSSGSSSSASTEDKKLKALKDRVALLKSELSLMQERGDSEEDQIAKMREIMAALNNEANYLKSIKGDQVTINNLTQEWYSYQNKISDLTEQHAQDAERQAEALQKAYEAQKALNNALKDRSVRYYNAGTGQWEWGANQQNVDSAREALRQALEAAGISNMSAWGLQYSMMAGMESIHATGDYLNSHPGMSVWDLPRIGQNGVTNNNMGTNNYGTTYNINGINLTEQQARGTSVYELAQMSRGLVLHSSTY